MPSFSPHQFTPQLTPQASPIGTGLTNPVLPAAAAPDANPGVWQNFLQKMKDDPNFQQSLMVMGLNLLGDPQQGESGFGTFSRSALQGVGHLDQLRQRDRAQNIQDQQLDIQKGQASQSVRRTNETIRRGDIAEDAAGVAATQGQTRIDILQDTLEENVRQFDLKASGEVSLQGPTTGTEREMLLAVKALVKSGEYPDTPEGKAAARVLASGLSGDMTDKDLMRMTMVKVADSEKFNVQKELFQPGTGQTQEEILTQSFQTVQTIAKMFRNKRAERNTGINPNGEDLRDAKATIPSTGSSVTVVPVGDGKFKLKNINGSMTTVTYSREEIDKILDKSEE